MRKFLSTLIAILGIATASMAQEKATTTDGKNPLTFSVEGKNITANLVGNSSTGYVWKYTISADDIVSMVKDEYAVPESENGQMMMGKPGVQTYVFEAVKPGKTIITFEYGQPWNNGRKAGIRTIQVKVSNNLTPKVKEK